MIHSPLKKPSAFAGKRIGLLGGSFNPAHEGHVAMSLYALKKLQLDEVWWLVNPQNPLKPVKDMVPLAERLRFARVLAKKHGWIQVTGLEEELGTRYTIDTLEALQEWLPDTHFVWLMGMDNLSQFDQWRRWEDLFQSVPIAVFRRPGYAAAGTGNKAARRFAAARQETAAAKKLALMKPPAWLVLDNINHPQSGTAIRRRRARKQPTKRIAARGKKEIRSR
jgi:nicotinate-nucleotide adenylyltransferase